MNFNCLSIEQHANVVKVTNLQKTSLTNLTSYVQWNFDITNYVTKSPEIILNMNDSMYTICFLALRMKCIKIDKFSAKRK